MIVLSLLMWNYSFVRDHGGGPTDQSTHPWFLLRYCVRAITGAVQLDPNDKAAPFNYVERLTRAAQSRWRRSILDSDDYHERAAGLLLQSSGWDYDSITGMPARTHDAELARDELVQLAAGLNDLPIYAMAIHATPTRS